DIRKERLIQKQHGWDSLEAPFPRFTVEIRRQKSASARANPRPVATKFAPSAPGGEPFWGAAAPEIAKVEEIVVEPAKPRPSGRILPDLTELERQNLHAAGGESSKAFGD